MTLVRSLNLLAYGMVVGAVIGIIRALIIIYKNS